MDSRTFYFVFVINILIINISEYSIILNFSLNIIKLNEYQR